VGVTLVGGWCSSGSPVMAEVLDRAGFDFVCVDAQHGFTADLPATLLGVQRATPAVRVPANDPAWIGRALDAGAEIVIVPMVDDPDAAGRAAAACRYPPDGSRSFGTNRSRLTGPPADVNASIRLLVMIETAAGVERAAEICAVGGVDGVYLGPADLAVGMGLPPGGDDDRLEVALGSVREACARAGVLAGIHCADPADAPSRADQGFDLVTVGTDVGLLRSAAAAGLAAVRERAR
jgi:4-hydroxy-2-oxoheptanedioate aldolase